MKFRAMLIFSLFGLLVGCMGPGDTELDTACVKLGNTRGFQSFERAKILLDLGVKPSVASSAEEALVSMFKAGRGNLCRPFLRAVLDNDAEAISRLL